MERGKAAKKINLDGRAEGKTSSSSSSLDHNQSEDQTEIENKTGQGSKAHETSVKNLPPEMWMEILKCVDTRSLFVCRLVNHLWSEISTRILHQRSDAKISFTYEEGLLFLSGRNPGPYDDDEESSLKRFLLCMSECKNIPLAHFAFNCEDERWYSVHLDFFFGHEDFKEFLSAVDESNENQNPNQRIKIKSLEFGFRDLRPPLEPLIDHLRDLLLKKIPHLEELGLNILSMCDRGEMYKKMKLFPKTVETPNPMVQLAHLKTFRFNPTMTSTCPGIVKDLLNAAVNLNKIYLYQSSRSFFTEIYDFLQPLGKFRLLKTFEFEINDQSLLKVKERSDFTDALFKLKLEELELELNYGGDSDSDFDSDADPELREAVLSSATIFISGLFESNKNSVEKLRTTPLGFLGPLQFPRFKNLTALKLKRSRVLDDTFFPRGVRARDIFPAVRKLEFPKWPLALLFPHLDSTPIFPGVETIIVKDKEFTADCTPVLSLLCPNLKHLKIQRDLKYEPRFNFYLVGRSIWTHLKTLESLEIDIHVDFPENNPTALDSCFTGISEENCQRLVEIRGPKKILEKWGFHSNVPESELTAEREHPSILDMTNLKTLKINAYKWKKWSHEWLAREDFVTRLTWISEEYAFKFLPHLKPQTTTNSNGRDRHTEN